LYTWANPCLSKRDIQTDFGKNGFMRILTGNLLGGSVYKGKRDFYEVLKRTGGKSKENAGKPILLRGNTTVEWGYACK
jgi:hypothetical protein